VYTYRFHAGGGALRELSASAWVRVGALAWVFYWPAGMHQTWAYVAGLCLMHGPFSAECPAPWQQQPGMVSVMHTPGLSPGLLSSLTHPVVTWYTLALNGTSHVSCCRYLMIRSTSQLRELRKNVAETLRAQQVVGFVSCLADNASSLQADRQAGSCPEGAVTAVETPPSTVGTVISPPTGHGSAAGRDLCFIVFRCSSSSRCRCQACSSRTEDNRWGNWVGLTQHCIAAQQQYPPFLVHAGTQV
jgi:hypothetical protein